jgi:hypothetical protein
MTDWKDKLSLIRDVLPPKEQPLTPIQRKPTRKEVIEQKIPVYYRVSDRIMRKTVKKV